MKQNKMNINPAIRITMALPLLALMVWGCGSTDGHRPIPWERPESPWRFQALLNEEPVEVEIDTAWIHPGNGVYFIVRLSTPSPFDLSYYNSQFSIIPAIRSIRSEEHTSELQSRGELVCRLLLDKYNKGRVSWVGY